MPMSPIALAAKSWELAQSIRAMSPAIGEGTVVLLGAVAIVQAADAEQISAQKAWERVTGEATKELFFKYFEQTQEELKRKAHGFPG